MTGLEIVLLIGGVIVLIAGFVIPQKKESNSEQVQEISREEIKQAIDGALSDAKIQIEEMAEETTNYAVEKTERAMERLTNEKITAVTEYADTVLKDINKNHQEVMFLYDMLTEKHETFLETVKEADKAAATVKESASGMERLKKHKTEQTKDTASDEEEKTEAVETFETEQKPEQRTASKKTRTTKKTVKAKEEKEQGRTHSAKNRAKELLAEPEQFNIRFSDSTDGEDSRNNNEKILALYKEGKSNTVIAKELGLGIGEVKLVIDLFKGMSS